MRKLKKQAEDAKARKALAKKEKGWVGGSTVPREVTLPTNAKVDEREDAPIKTSSMIDTTGKGAKQNSINKGRVVGGFDFEELD